VNEPFLAFLLSEIPIIDSYACWQMNSVHILRGFIGLMEPFP